MTGFVLVSFSGRVLAVQEVLRTVIIAPYRKAILVLCRFCRCVILPIKAQIHIKALTFFNNVCHQGEKKNTEKKLARRQLTVKEESSNSWFIGRIPVSI
jgi:hypothetical protein